MNDSYVGGVKLNNAKANVFRFTVESKRRRSKHLAASDRLSKIIRIINPFYSY